MKVSTEDNTALNNQQSQGKVCSNKQAEVKGKKNVLNNTFGWTRIEVLMILIVCVFFSSLCFSILVEALQTLVHINHMDAMHNPFVVLIMGVIGLLLNGFCYLLIGGYTYYQGSFLHITASNEVVLEDVVTATSKHQGSRPRKSVNGSPIPRQRQGVLEAFRDIISCLFVIMGSLIVYFTDNEVAKFIDPALAIASAMILLILTLPSMKESGLILLQTMPKAMNIEVLNTELLKTFPDIVNVHDFHIWQLTSTKVYATIHIVFSNPLDFTRQCDKVTEFLLEQGISQVVIQPEFKVQTIDSLNDEENDCLMKCREKGCENKHCCTKSNFISYAGPTSIITSDNILQTKNEETSDGHIHITSI